nr:uncharacterized protein LOC118879576 isoform X3 [Drosophila suzukii]
MQQNLTKYRLEDQWRLQTGSRHQSRPHAAAHRPGSKRGCALVGHYLQRASDGTSRMDSAPTRRQRSIDWLGSAWKWVLGSPDKSDWNAILKEEDSLLNLPTRKDWSGQHESLGSRRDQYDIGGGGQPALSKRR